MAELLDICRFTAGSTGTGAFVDGTAEQGFQNLNDAGAVHGTTYPYRAENATRTEWEIGYGVYDSGAGELSRAPLKSSNASALVDFTTSPVVLITPLARELVLATAPRVGELVWLTATSVPAGVPAVIANGSSLLRSTYATLWTFAQASGNLAASEGVKEDGQYGPGDGSTTFTIPDLTTGGRFIRAKTAGATMGSEQADDNKSHTHSTTPSEGNITRYTSPGGSVGTAAGSNQAFGITINSSGGAEARPVNVSLIPILYYE